MTIEKFLPSRSPISFWGCFDPMPFQNIRDGGVRQDVAQIRDCTLNSTITPRPVFLSHAVDQVGDLA